MASAGKFPGAGSWVVIGSLAIVAATLGVVLSSGLSLANAAGRPIDAPAVSITPTAPHSNIPSPSPTPPAPAGAGAGAHDGPPSVVAAPLPVTVTLDDNGAEGHGGKDSGGGKDSSRDGSGSKDGGGGNGGN